MSADLFKYFYALLLIWGFTVAPTGTARADDVQLRPINIQLKWLHQFQFAGYYQAQAQGYFREVGLDVKLLEGRPDLDPVQVVMDRRASFGVGSAELILARSRGVPVVAVAAIFQHSPFIVMAKSDVFSVHDLPGRRMMVEPNSAELLAYLLSEHVPVESIVTLPHTGNPMDIETAEVDALTAYVTTEPYVLNTAGGRYRVFDPKSSGVDFYGDVLFTTDDVIKRDPELVRMVRAAVIKGWAYALAHQTETVDLIIQKFPSHLSREALLYEAQAIRKLAIPDVVEIGYMNPGRWKFIAESFIQLGMTTQLVDLNSFMFDYHQPVDLSALYYGLAGISFFAIIAALLAGWMRRLNSKLNLEIANRVKLEDELRHQASTDYLTGLLNRRGFMELGEREILRSLRFGTPLTALMIDIDHFKKINDTFGHQTGDQVLHKMADICHSQLREVDIIGRMGGEEFAVLLSHTSLEEGLEVAERIRATVEESSMGVGSGQPLYVTCSIGVAGDSPERTMEEFLFHADNALYLAKKTGRNRVCAS